MKIKAILAVAALLGLFCGIAGAQTAPRKHSAAWYRAHRKAPAHSAAWYRSHRKASAHSAAWYRAHRKPAKHSAAWYRTHKK